MTRGRVISGFVRGIGCEYFSLDINPTFSRDVFYEAHDLIVRAWTEPGPFEHVGQHFQYRYVNVWPRPYTKPHPPSGCCQPAARKRSSLPLNIAIPISRSSRRSRMSNAY